MNRGGQKLRTQALAVAIDALASRMNAVCHDQSMAVVVLAHLATIQGAAMALPSARALILPQMRTTVAALEAMGAEADPATAEAVFSLFFDSGDAESTLQ